MTHECEEASMLTRSPVRFAWPDGQRESGAGRRRCFKTVSSRFPGGFQLTVTGEALSREEVTI
jgi:hypothetical protein